MPLAYYNLMTSSQGTAAIDLMAIASQGDPYSGHMFNDSTIVINDDNVVLLDKFGEPVLDENGEMFDVHNPLAPGEPRKTACSTKDTHFYPDFLSLVDFSCQYMV